MRRVTRFSLAEDLRDDRRDALIALFVELEMNARHRRGRDPFEARRTAELHRQLIAAFCVPRRALDLHTCTYEERRHA